MTLQQLIDELTALPKELRHLPVRYEYYGRDGEVKEVTVYAEDGYLPNEKRPAVEIYLH